MFDDFMWMTSDCNKHQSPSHFDIINKNVDHRSDTIVTIMNDNC